jgi:hypothetical protein
LTESLPSRGRTKAADAEMLAPESGSFLLGGMTDEEFDRFEAEFNPSPDPKPARRVKSDVLEELMGRVDVPFAVGQRR